METKMNTSIQHLVAKLGIAKPPLEKSNLSKINFGARIPADLMHFYSICDGIIINPRLKIRSFEEGVSYFTDVKTYYNLQKRQWFPLTENNDSRPWCVCLDDVMQGYVIQVHPDDTPELKFRNIESFLNKLYTHVVEQGQNLYNMEGELDCQSLVDVEIADKLIRQALTLKDSEKIFTINLGFCFQDLGNVNKVIELLNYSDEDIIWEIDQFLNSSSRPEHQQILSEFNQRVRRFGEQCLEELKRRRISGYTYDDQHYVLKIKGTFYNLTLVYASKRKLTNGIKLFIDEIAQK
jgi:hypothetical protein